MVRDHGMLPGLERVEVPPEAGDLPVPHFVDCFIRDAEDRAEEMGDRAGKGLFIPGDYRYAFQILQWLLRTKAVDKGAAFLEWGSGQGMVAILAALLGYESAGVEIDEALVKESRELAARYDVSARFEHGSYDPNTEGLKVFTAKKRAAVYVYPWPGEEPYFLQLFSETAQAGAFLLMCLGPEDIRVYRKKGR
jgi:predicted O-methyltransferase YrrM